MVPGFVAGSGALANKTSAALANTSALCARMPIVSNVGANGFIPAVDMTPCEGRKPQIPQLLAGTRTDPLVSVPKAKSTRAYATAEADPLEDPPGTRSGACGLRGVP